jgi:hypothetical protein
VISDAEVVQDSGDVREGVNLLRELESSEELLGSTLILELAEQNVACCRVEVERMVSLSVLVQTGRWRTQDLESAVGEDRRSGQLAPKEMEGGQLIVEVKVLLRVIHAIDERQSFFERLVRRLVVSTALANPADFAEYATARGRERRLRGGLSIAAFNTLETSTLP